MATGGTAYDGLGVRIEVGDHVMITAWGGNVRLTDVRRTGTIKHVGRVRPVIEWDSSTDTPRGNVRSEALGVLRRDGNPGFEGNAK